MRDDQRSEVAYNYKRNLGPVWSMSAMRAGRIASAVLLLALLVSCSAVRLSYDNADWVLARMAGSYVDMDRAQARALKAELAELHAWHRHEELPRYSAFLDEASERLEHGLAREDVVWAIGTVRVRYEVLSRQAAQGMEPLLLTLNPRQVDRLQARFETDNRKFYASNLPEDPEKAVRMRAATRIPGIVLPAPPLAEHSAGGSAARYLMR